ncbi:hypothetical protein CALVIDRAFT_319072 [Calocera viscosa TUFC12733]|uniref:Uncharacterized protein n=1 Tax=Calocera viscosa (strain TUFC12733) TaxID=1330018 RepID=A0A167HYZ2_CALVF|nr:hypothetical protein CALVIDRAFT_319072 [Calocera viscosa TUFC12733]
MPHSSAYGPLPSPTAAPSGAPAPKSSRLFTRVKHAFLRSPRSERFAESSDAEGHARAREREGEVIDVRRERAAVEAAYEVRSAPVVAICCEPDAPPQATARQHPSEPSTPTPTSVLPRITVHSPFSPYAAYHPPSQIDEDLCPTGSGSGAASDGETYRPSPSIRKRGSDIRSVAGSRPATAGSRRESADQGVQCDLSSSSEDLPSASALARVRALEDELATSQASLALAQHEADDLRTSLSNTQREADALHLELLISEKFIETIKAENRELLMDLAHLSGAGADGASVSHLGLGSRGWEDSGSDMPTRPTSVASSFDAASFLSSGAWSAPPQPVVRSPVGRTASQASAPGVLSGGGGMGVLQLATDRKTPEPSLSFPLPLPLALPIPLPGNHGGTSPNGTGTGQPAPAQAHNHHRRPTATSISSSSSSHQDPASPPSAGSLSLGFHPPHSPLTPHAHQHPPYPPPPPPPPMPAVQKRDRKLGPQRRDSVSSLRRTSHSHTPTQPSPLALDVLSHEDTEGDGEEGGEGGASGTAGRESASGSAGGGGERGGAGRSPAGEERSRSAERASRGSVYSDSPDGDADLDADLDVAGSVSEAGTGTGLSRTSTLASADVDEEERAL